MVHPPFSVTQLRRGLGWPVRARSTLVCFTCAALLAGVALYSVPWNARSSSLLTPLDLTTARELAPGYTLLRAADQILPPKVSVVVRTSPPRATLETWYYRLGVGLLPGRQLLPSAVWNTFTDPAIWKDAEYLVLVGKVPEDSPGHLLLATPYGTVWRRERP